MAHRFPIETSEGQAVHLALARAFTNPHDTIQLAGSAQLDAIDFNMYWPPRLLWLAVLDEAIHRDRLPDLFEIVIQRLKTGPVVDLVRTWSAPPDPDPVAEPGNLVARFVFERPARLPKPRIVFLSRKIPLLPRRGRPHYVVTILVHGLPRVVTSVEYELERDFRNPVRVVTTPHEFHHELHSYGECLVTATYTIDAKQVRKIARLSSMLDVGHAGDSNPRVLEAIDTIEHA